MKMFFYQFIIFAFLTADTLAPYPALSFKE